MYVGPGWDAPRHVLSVENEKISAAAGGYDTSNTSPRLLAGPRIPSTYDTWRWKPLDFQHMP